ncbi:MAG: chemotaxis protein CheW [Bacillota bacterium]|uniref:chemotaxis protein CheW n=1 Tax=Thermanaerosceptrum fracticalcis TaxID=1712410 RepID=UPI0005556F80|nr:chemotaxis protein CheW [Thermanaerosceptrum fracticalcis]
MQEEQYVIFRFNAEHYGVDILSVQEIIRPPKITKLPNTPPHVLGVINLRGNIIPIVDLKIRFNFEDFQNNKDERIIVLRIDDKLMGIQVDEVQEVLRLKTDQIEQAADICTTIDREFIAGIAKLDDRLIILLSLKGSL